MTETIDYEDHCVYIEFNGKRWKWPAKDEKLLQVNDWVNDLDVAVLAMRKAGRDCKIAIQGGGACGVWPVALAEHFEMIFTFEPDLLNYWCLSANVSHLPTKIFPANFALGENPGTVVTKSPPTEKNNTGAYYTVPATIAEIEGGLSVPQITIDSMEINGCDLLCLDIEGREVEALRGAYKTIDEFRPFVMIEEKPLPQMGKGKDVAHVAGEAKEWLEKIHGYKVIREVHRDLIMAPDDSL
jgi:FkbM family methyltransferase